MMILMPDFYHSVVLDAVEKAVNQTFDEEMAGQLKKDIAYRMNQLVESNTKDNFQKELNALMYPILAAQQSLEYFGVPKNLALSAMKKVWEEIPEEDRVEELRRALGEE